MLVQLILSSFHSRATFYEFGEQDHIWMTHPFNQKPDMFITTGKIVNMTSGIPSPVNASNGDWFFNNITKEFTYIVTGRKGLDLIDQDINLQVRSNISRELKICIRGELNLDTLLSNFKIK